MLRSVGVVITLTGSTTEYLQSVVLLTLLPAWTQVATTYRLYTMVATTIALRAEYYQSQCWHCPSSTIISVDYCLVFLLTLKIYYSYSKRYPRHRVGLFDLDSLSLTTSWVEECVISNARLNSYNVETNNRDSLPMQISICKFESKRKQNTVNENNKMSKSGSTGVLRPHDQFIRWIIRRVSRSNSAANPCCRRRFAFYRL